MVLQDSYGTGGSPVPSHAPETSFSFRRSLSTAAVLSMAAFTSDTIHGHTLRSSRRNSMLLARWPSSADFFTSSNWVMKPWPLLLTRVTMPGTSFATSPPGRKNSAPEPTHIRMAAAMNHFAFLPQTCSRRLPTGDRLMEISEKPRPWSARPMAVDRFMALAAKSLAALPSTLIFSNSSRRRISTCSWSLRNLRRPGMRNVLPRPTTCVTGLSGCSDW